MGDRGYANLPGIGAIHARGALDEAGCRRRWNAPGDSPPARATRQGCGPTAGAAVRRLLGIATRLG
jgi:hypothetical protein